MQSILDPRLKKKFDIPLLMFTYLLAGIGIIVLFSVTHAEHPTFYRKQIVWVVLGSLGLIVTTAVDYHMYARFSRQIYLLNLVLLLIVLKFAHNANGSGRWIGLHGFQFQPSELAKLLMILALAAFLARRAETIGTLKTVLVSLVYVSIPALCIMRQPDLGTALVLIAIWFGMIFMAGARLRHLAGILVGGALLFALLWFTGRGISAYQRHRIDVFLNPGSDAANTGFHVHQARIAVGSGGIWGRGLIHNMPVYIPEKTTDFIFSAVGENLGFVGGVVLTLLYAGLLVRGYTVIATVDEDGYGKLVATGVVTMLAFHVILNIGMNIGIMPVAGVPLPLISAGGSNVLVTMACIGVLESVSIHRH